MAGEKLARAIKQCASQAIPKTSLTDLMFGTVTSIDPLKIMVENRFEVDSNFLLLSPFCIEKKVKINIPSHNHTASASEHIVAKHKHFLDESNSEETQENSEVTLNHSIKLVEAKPSTIEVVIWGGLQVGDKVSLLRVAEGQKYYVLDRGGSI